MPPFLEELQSKLLKRQIKKNLDFLSVEELEKFKSFFESVDDEYTYVKEKLLESQQAYEVSNQELETINEEINKKKEELSDKTKQLSDILRKNIRVTKKLEESKRNLELIVNNLSEWLIVVEDWKIILANSWTSDIVWYSKKYLTNRNFPDIFNFVDEKWKYLNGFVDDIIKSNTEFHRFRNIFLQLGNSNIPVSVMAKSLKGFTGEWTACVISFKDITEEKKIEDMKTEFLSIASHELRTPMTVIRWYVSLFVKWKLWNITEKQQEYLEKILENTVWLIDMVNDVLDINKLEAGKMVFSYDLKNVKDIVAWCVNDMKWLINQKKINITTELEDIISVCDENKIKQVVVNFLSNAYKFTKGGGNISVGLKLEGDFMKISVKDSWVWIEKADIWKLFQKFSQVWSYLNKTEKWTWLGLSICKQIVEEMWWKISVESDIWIGSTFSFALPYREDSSEEKEN